MTQRERDSVSFSFGKQMKPLKHSVKIHQESIRFRAEKEQS